MTGPDHYVYVLECSDGSLYTGYTTDVERRVDEHDAGEGAKYTRGRTPVDLVHVESFDSRSTALQREHEIKRRSRAAKERLVYGERNAVPNEPERESPADPTTDTARGRTAGMLEAGDPAPDVEAPNQHGQATSPDVEAPTVVYFYVEDGTPGCATQADQFAREADAYDDAGVTVFGVSTDDVDAHREFAEAHDVPYDLLADPDGDLCNAFGVPRDASGRAERTTFVLADGHVKAVYDGVSADGHARDVLMDMMDDGLVSL